MSRTTLKDIDQGLKVLNNAIKDKGVQVKLGQRYGYKALDLYNMKGGCLKTVRTGMSSGETMQCIWDIMKGIYLIEEGTI